MAETIQIGEIAIALARKNIKNVQLSVHPPNARDHDLDLQHLVARQLFRLPNDPRIVVRNEPPGQFGLHCLPPFDAEVPRPHVPRRDLSEAWFRWRLRRRRPASARRHNLT
jgi:hypothetical protein